MNHDCAACGRWARKGHARRSCKAVPGSHGLASVPVSSSGSAESRERWRCEPVMLQLARDGHHFVGDALVCRIPRWPAARRARAVSAGEALEEAGIDCLASFSPTASSTSNGSLEENAGSARSPQRGKSGRRTGSKRRSRTSARHCRARRNRAGVAIGPSARVTRDRASPFPRPLRPSWTLTIASFGESSAHPIRLRVQRPGAYSWRTCEGSHACLSRAPDRPFERLRTSSRLNRGVEPVE